jgi:tRNA A37 threonylcarbamoyladenosine dehydratase
MQSSDSYQQRFGGIERLYGAQATHTLLQSHILVIGIGGVGSWTAEALARSGLGAISLMDLDDICVTNTNRQIHADKDSIGKSKTAVMAARLQVINPEINIYCIDDFLDSENIAQYITGQYSLIIDAIDNTAAKTTLIAHCKRHKLKLICIGSAGGKKDPTKITYGDLSKTVNDPLFAKIRNNLRRHYRFSRNPKRSFGIEAIYSTEQMTYPDKQGGICQSKVFLDGGEKLDCSGGYGAATMVTASFGFIAAARAIEKLIKTN